jgi:hypothetical protein
MPSVLKPSARCVCAVAGIVLGVTVFLASSALADVTVRLQSRTATALTSDGSRFAYYSTTGAVLVVRDDLRGGSRRFALPAACRPIDATSAVLLLVCRDRPPENRPVLLDPRTGATVSLTTTIADADVYAEIGRHWMAGARCAVTAGHCTPVYRNWRTGEVRTVSYLADLDSPGLAPRSAASADWLTFGSGHGPSPLILVHRGVRRTISRCTRACSLQSAGAGIATWLSGPTPWSAAPSTFRSAVVRYSVATRRRWTVSLHPHGLRRAKPEQLVHTRTRTYVLVADKREQTRLYRIRY